MPDETTALARRLTIQESLQEYCDIILDDATGVTWDLYRAEQKDKLELKVRLALFSESVSVNERTGEVSAVDHLSAFRDRFLIPVSIFQSIVLEEPPTGSNWEKKDFEARHVILSVET